MNESPKTSLYFFNKNSNFGDQLNIAILQKILNVEPVFESVYKCQLVAIGSLLESFLHGSGKIKLAVKKLTLPQLNIWGSGFIAPPETRIINPKLKQESFFRKVNIHALRGQSSKQRVEQMFDRPFDIALGDPGLLASKLINTDKTIKKYRYGIVPHYVDKDNPLVSDLQKNLNESIILDIMDDPITFLTKVSECENIISSAMHGLIAADSLGIPNVRAVFSDKIAGGNYKFNDYYSVFGLKDLAFFKPEKSSEFQSEINALIDDYSISRDTISEIQSNLLNSFPKFK
ncbi:polysaccharide pyruvyl transferase family protein [Brumimicrobium mesophilum]|uniref:polysaccharide pyruvyl transferase family protein n=1 Tax=Brumimicrobium mesophilum TaxID=392717 RepID=UPI000D142124|nr:polysaccharide pyruvyl transferase family protein [Brumimicrobium mesophilum]